MKWWRVKTDTSARRELERILSAFGKQVLQGDARAFFTPLVTEPDGVAGYFRKLFNERGDGGSAFGASWKPISDGWRKQKAKTGHDTRIGFYTQELFKSLTVSGENGNISRVFKRRAIFGTKLPQGAYFSKDRPVILPGDGEQLKRFLQEGEGKQVYDEAVAAYRASVLGGVATNRRFKNLFK